MRVNPTRRALAESAVAALTSYVVAAGLEALAIRWLRPAVYVWRRLLTTRQELAARERAELVLQTQLSLAAEIQ